jgi:hypothetical protein
VIESFCRCSKDCTHGCRFQASKMDCRKLTHTNSRGCNKCKHPMIQVCDAKFMFCRLLVLSAQNTYSPPTFSFSARTPPSTAGETAIKDLLRLVRSPRPQQDTRNQKFKQSPAGFSARTPTFFSGGLPRDRRGRVVPKGKNPLDTTVQPASA